MKYFWHKKFIIIFLGAILLGIGLFFAHTVLAQSIADPNSQLQQGVQVITKTGLPTTDIRVVAANIIRVALGLLGIIVLALMLYGGFIWMTASGNEEKITEAKKILRNATVGLIIILSAYAIVSFVMSKLLAATGTGTGNDTTNITTGCTNPMDCPLYSNSLYIDGLPPADVCIQNYHPLVSFNRPIDLSTVPANIITNASSGLPVSGSWSFISGHEDMIEFVATGNCPGGGNDCFNASTTYKINFPAGSVLAKDSTSIKLICNSTRPCVKNFKTGEAVDHTAPTVVFDYPAEGDAFNIGDPVHFDISATDDIAVQTVSLYIGQNKIAPPQIFEGCRSAVTTTFYWSTSYLSTRTKLTPTASAFAYDFSARSSTAERSFILRPEHCYNGLLDPQTNDPYDLQPEQFEERANQPPLPDCGGTDCGSCSGSNCTKNSDCASGYCNQTTKKCEDKLKITDFTPSSGGPGTFVSIAGMYFGTNRGQVYFPATSARGADNEPTSWIPADLAPCGSNGESWKPYQIIVTVPKGAVDGPIKVVNASSTFSDFTNDAGWGPVLNDFNVNTTIHPGLCPINPPTSTPNVKIDLTGKKFGASKGQVKFGELANYTGSKDFTALTDTWGDTGIKTLVPIMDPLWTGVAVFDSNSNRSNVVRFKVMPGSASTTPIITSVTPNHGARGTYITVTGRNFGTTKGHVYLKLNGEGSTITSSAKIVDDFPPKCKNTTWSDTQIIIKFPKDSSVGTVGEWYSIQVDNVDTGETGLVDESAGFTLEAGKPNPGICDMTPDHGPAPLAAKGTVHIVGEYFAPETSNPNYANAYFWGANSDSSTVSTNRVSSTRDSALGFTLAEVPYAGNPATVASEMNAPIPTDIASGPVVVHRDGDPADVISNPYTYTKYDCVANGNVCQDPDDRCCTVGTDAGVCKNKYTDICVGQSVSSGYAWMFSTMALPQAPQVVERCDNSSKSPSPSPSAQWVRADFPREHERVCLGALVTIEFTAPSASGGIDTLTPQNIEVRKCEGDADVTKRTCTSTPADVVPMKDLQNNASTFHLSDVLGNRLLMLTPSTGQWATSTWYQVVVKDNIQDASTTPIKATFACEPGAAYCAVFKTGTENCKMKSLLIVPDQYRTSILDTPLMHYTVNSGESDFYYTGLGLTQQYCVTMNLAGFDWKWSSQRPGFADIYDGTTTQWARISTFQNTVGVGLTSPDNALNIHLKVSTTTIDAGLANYEKDSPLKIDLSNPQVVDYWPKCLATCLNADIGARFNVTLSNWHSALDQGIKLKKCKDENCFSTTDVTSSVGFTAGLNPANDREIIITKNGNLLSPNTTYQVTLSAGAPDTGSSDLLWSRQNKDYPDSHASPMEQTFVWRFRTKADSCSVNRVDVEPKSFLARIVGQKKVYSAQPYSTPDECSVTGQRLDAWGYNWNWGSSNNNVASVDTWKTIKKNPYCTDKCVKLGSSIPAGYTAKNQSVCGNGVVEAGEDCDIGKPGETPQSCTLNCLRPGNANVGMGVNQCGNKNVDTAYGEECDPASTDPLIANGCSNNCLHVGSKTETEAQAVGASVCGNGTVGAGEECDTGNVANYLSPTSSVLCSQNCLHIGSTISANWCDTHAANRGGYDTSSFWAVCSSGRSRCGDGETSADEDAGCDLGNGQFNSSTCNIYCLKKSVSGCKDAAGNSKEGYSADCQYLGSSLSYSAPSVCGDGVPGTGENPECETSNTAVNLNHNFFNPWTLVKAVGMGSQVLSDVTPAVQRAIIGATTTNVGGTGVFDVQCGYTTDKECQDAMGALNPGNSIDYGVAANTCCYARMTVKNIYPGNEAINVCRNSSVYVGFDKILNASSINGNFLVAKGVTDPVFGGMTNFDVGAPVTVSGYSTYATNATGMVVSGNILVVLYKDADMIEFVDISNPLAPKRLSVVKDGVGGAHLKKPIKAFVRANRYVTVVSQGSADIEFLDIINPAEPKHLKFIHSTTDGDAITDITAADYYTPNDSLFRVFLLGKTVKTGNKNVLLYCPGECSVVTSSWAYDFSDVVGIGASDYDHTGNNGSLVYLFYSSADTAPVRLLINLKNPPSQPPEIVSHWSVPVSDFFAKGLVAERSLSVDYLWGFDSSGKPKAVVISSNIATAPAANGLTYEPIANGVTSVPTAFAIGSVYGKGTHGIVDKLAMFGFKNSNKIAFSSYHSATGVGYSAFDNTVALATKPGSLYAYALSASGQISVLFTGEARTQIATDVQVFAKDTSNSKYLYNAVQRGGFNLLQVWDITIPDKPRILNSVPIVYPVAHLLAQDGIVYAFTNNSQKNTVIYDFTDPFAPKLLYAGSPIAVQQISDVVKRDNHLYAFSINTVGSNNYDNRLDILDISDPRVPKVVGSLTTTTNDHTVVPIRLFLSGDYTYTLSAPQSGSVGYLSVVNISDPTAPKVTKIITLSESNSAFSEESITANESYLYWVHFGMSSIYDLSSIPGDPQLVFDGALGGNGSIRLDGKYLYFKQFIPGAPSAYRIKVFDVSSSTKPFELSSTKSWASANNYNKDWISANGRLYIAYSYGTEDPFSNLNRIINVDSFTSQSDCDGANDVTDIIKGISLVDTNMPWYQKLWLAVVNLFNKIFVGTVTAAGGPSKWCVDDSLGNTYLEPGVEENYSQISFALNRALDPGAQYAIILKSDLRDSDGVSLGHIVTSTFTTAANLCAVSAVSVTPTTWLFSQLNTSTNFTAHALSDSNQQIVPIPSVYSWEYFWGPQNNDYVTLQNTTASTTSVSPKNKNGEIDIGAIAKITVNTANPNSVGMSAVGTSHVQIFLCNNPWPSTDYSSRKFRLPYEDKTDNDDNFDLSSGIFDGNPIAKSTNLDVSDNGYFNFGTYYCMDSGGPDKVDDLPFLRPAVQGNYADIKTSAGTCSVTGDTCNVVQQDCDWRFTAPAQSFFANSTDTFCFATSSVPTTNTLFYVNSAPLPCKYSSDCSYNPEFHTKSNVAVCAKPVEAGFATSSQVCVERPQPLKRFLFTNQLNSDVIGIQVFANPQVFTVDEWYNNDKTLGGQGFSGAVQHLTVDGYPAVRNDNNVYVDVLNVTTSTPDPSEPNKFFSNIFLFSINQGATEQTKQIFSQLLTNLHLNANLSNFGYCGVAVDTPDIIDPLVCQTDFDCPHGKVCANQKLKLQRDYTRLRNLRELGLNLQNYFTAHKFYPALKDGTYLPGQVVSTWPGWTALSNALGYNVAVDPVNKLPRVGTCSASTTALCNGDNAVGGDVVCPSGDKCVIHDPITGWSAQDRRFSFVCDPTALAYRYFSSSSVATDFEVRSGVEEIFSASNLMGNNGWSKFRDAFLGEGLNGKVKIGVYGGICQPGQFISTVSQGHCGDGQVNIGKGEECDPPGKKYYDTSQCVNQNGEVKLQTCDSNCKWSETTTTCANDKFRKCGNGKVEKGEKCDDGPLNGKYNHCNSNCDGWSSEYCGNGIVSSTHEICDVKKSRNDINVGDVISSGLGVCDFLPKYCSSDEGCKYSDAGVNKGTCIKTADLYGFTKDKSCASDCQAYGPYCGDKIVQQEFGEKCEIGDTKACQTGDGRSGTQECNSICRGWATCLTTETLTPPTPESKCGNGKVESNEACDLGAAKNGIACTPKYGQTCSYCADNCKDWIDVQSNQYCGNGLVEDPEQCDGSDGCGQNCLPSTNYKCTPKENICYSMACANGIPGTGGCIPAKDSSGNNITKDGCRADCTAEVDKGYECYTGGTIGGKWSICVQKVAVNKYKDWLSLTQIGGVGGSASCGDGVVDTASGEECDQGDLNGLVYLAPGTGDLIYHCNSDCTKPTGGYCGDGTQDTTEKCDYGVDNILGNTPADDTGRNIPGVGTIYNAQDLDKGFTGCSLKVCQLFSH